MKRILIICSLLLCTMVTIAQSSKYAGAMKASIKAIDTSFNNPASLLALANTFERIGAAEKTEWLPYYYAAFLQVNYGFMTADKSKTDEIADKAEQLINKADSLSPSNSEISTIKSMIASCRLMVDPMSRYMEYGPVSNAELEKAIQQDPLNPRPYYLKGQALKFTPEQFGGGCKSASIAFEKAIQAYSTFKPVSELHPDWGAVRTKQLLDECRK
jgi:hypothetical protein